MFQGFESQIDASEQDSEHDDVDNADCQVYDLLELLGGGISEPFNELLGRNVGGAEDENHQTDQNHTQPHYAEEGLAYFAPFEEDCSESEGEDVLAPAYPQQGGRNIYFAIGQVVHCAADV